MTKKFTQARIEAALKQAAKAAVSGTREERSGRFLAGAAEPQAQPTPSSRPEPRT